MSWLIEMRNVNHVPSFQVIRMGVDMVGKIIKHASSPQAPTLHQQANVRITVDIRGAGTRWSRSRAVDLDTSSNISQIGIELIGNWYCQSLYTTNGATHPGISNYVFNNDGGLTVSETLTSITVNCPSGDRTSHSFETIEYGNWSFDGNSLTVNSEVISEFGIQYKNRLVATQSNPGQGDEVSFRLLNFHIDNAHRLPCRNTGLDLTPRLIW